MTVVKRGGGGGGTWSSMGVFSPPESRFFEGESSFYLHFTEEELRQPESQ